MYSFGNTALMHPVRHIWSNSFSIQQSAERFAEWKAPTGSQPKYLLGTKGVQGLFIKLCLDLTRIADLIFFCKFTFFKCTLSTSTFRPQIVLSGRLFARGSLARKTLKIVFSSSTPEHSSSDAQLFTFLVFRSARTSENTSGFRFYLFIHFFFSDYILVFYPPYLSQLSWPKSVTRVSHISSATLS